MQLERRTFLKRAGSLGMAGALAATPAASASSASSAASDHGGGHSAGPKNPDGVLVDLELCVGCRSCERACKSANGIEPGTLESYNDQSVMKQPRRPGPDALTVVHRAKEESADSKPVYVKLNCVHCNQSACVSACIVGALTKQENGAVTYSASKCIGCRYCMVACPFQLPAYSYNDVLTPEVRKCQFCFDSRTSQGKMPACVEACPQQAMTYGKRSELLKQAHEDKLKAEPERYVQHIYGEHEVGGTSWMYLSGTPFEQLGFLKVGTVAPSILTENIQHGVFKYWIAPVGWYGFLSAMMWWTGRKHRVAAAEAKSHANNGQNHADSGDDEAGAAPGARLSAAALAHAGEDTLAPGEEHSHFAPVKRKLLTPGVWALLALVITGFAFGLYRFFVGLGAATNLDQQHPWGLWIAMDVGSGIALAGGGFVTAALVHIFHRETYHAVARSALLTALLGYTFYVPGLLADIGRWYNIWHPTIPTMWQGNSVLFEVGLCVMIYLNVQYAEIFPIVLERVLGTGWAERRPKLGRLMKFTHDSLERIMPALLVLGVALSTFHQSSLGNLMVIAPYKLHHLWWTPMSPLLFLLSAMMVGFPMVIFTMLFGSWCLKRRPEMHVLAPLSRYVPVILIVYLVLKVADIVVRGMHRELGGAMGTLWLIEMIGGVVVPLGMLVSKRVRWSAKWLGIACLLVILGVVLNRLNVFVLGYHPPYATKSYFPSVTEFALSIGLVAALMLVYRVAVTYLPILEPAKSTEAEEERTETDTETRTEKHLELAPA